MRLAMRACLEKLAGPRRRVVMLRLQGFSLKEVGRLLGLDEKQVKNLTFRGISDLRACLAAKGMAP